MKISKIFFVSIFLLAVLTIGTVSAADDAGSVAAIDGGDEAIADSPAEDIELGDTGSIDDGVLSDDNYMSAALDSDVVEFEGYIGVNVTISDNVDSGTIIYYIDNSDTYEEYNEYDEVYDDDLSFYHNFKLDSDVGFGKHVLYVDYAGGDHPNKVIQLPFTVSGFYMDVDWNEPVYGNDVFMDIDVPLDAEGTITVELNGKTYTLVYDEDGGWNAGGVNIDKNDIVYGYNTATVTFTPFNSTGDFPEKTINSTEKILSYISIYSDGSENFEYNRNTTVSLLLPSDAKGKLQVRVDGKNYTVSSNNGLYAHNITFAELGTHEIFAIYDGTDYEINYGEEFGLDDDYTRIIEVYPKVDIPEKIWQKDKLVVSIEMPEKYNGNVTFYTDVFDYDTFEGDAIELASAQIKNGKATASFNVEGDYITVYAFVNCTGYENILPSCSVEVEEGSPDFDFEFDSYDVLRQAESQILGELISEDFDEEDFLLKIDDDYFDFEFDGEYIVIDASTLSLEKHAFTVIYLGDGYHSPKNVTGTFSVGTISVYIPNVNLMDEAADITLQLPNNIKGKITVKVGGTTLYSENIADEAWFDEDLNCLYMTISLDGMGYGVKTVTVLHGTSTLASKKVNSTYSLGLEENTVRYGGDQIEIIYPDGAEKTLSATIDGKTAKVSVIREDGYIDEAYLITPADLAIGNHTVVLKYSGDDMYPARSVTLTIEVFPSIHVNETVSKGDGISLVLPDNAQGNLIVKINDKEYVVNVTDGIAAMKFDDLPFGYYDIEAYYNGTDYDVGDISDRFTINPEFNVPEKIAKGDNSVISISLAKNVEGRLVVWYDGADDEVSKDLMNGKASISLSFLPVGTQQVTVYFYHYRHDEEMGEDFEDSYEENYIIDVINPIVAKDTAVVYSQNAVYSVQIRDVDGNAVDGGKVTFYIMDGKKQLVKKDVAVNNGVAKLSYKITQGVKTYKIKTVYGKASVTKKLTVKHVVTLKKVTVKKSAKKLVITATLKKVNGKYLKNKKVTFKFGSTTYKNIKTNSKGVAKITVKSSILKKLKVGKKVTYQATYLKDTVKKSVKVKK